MKRIVAGMFFLGVIFFMTLNPLFVLAQPGSTDVGVPADIIEELKLYSKAMGAILEGYVEDIKPRTLFYDAVRGMTKSLDKHCEFIDPVRYDLLKISMKGEYAGIGTWIAEEDGVAIVDNIKPGSPAEKAGIAIKDRILKVDGVPTAGKTVPEVGAMLRGEPETAVILTLFRKTLEQTFEVSVVRERIEIEALRDVRIVGRAVGYAAIVEWNEHTLEQFDKALADLETKGMEALIIDLRGNSGGILGSAVDLAQRFLPKGAKIVSVESKVDVQQKEHFASGERAILDLPLIVLVNEGSASASEIFSAAMQDNGRAKIVGMKTYGKASVQSVIPLDDVSAMRLTTARYKSPKGRRIDGVGVMPDLVTVDGLPSDPGAQLQVKKALQIFKKYY